VYVSDLGKEKNWKLRLKEKKMAYQHAPL